MNTAVKTIIGMALLAAALAVLLLAGGPIASHMAGAVVTGAGGKGEAEFEFSGYLILMAINLGLASVVAWMLFGKQD